MQPGPDNTVCDPACGTGGFLLAAHDYVAREHGSALDPDQKAHLRTSFVHGWEIVPATARLCIMNLYLHGIGHNRKETWGPAHDAGRWRAFEYDELAKRDKLNLDLLWLRDSALTDGENLPEPEVLAAEIVEDLHAALQAFQVVADELELTSDGMALGDFPLEETGECDP